MLDRGRLRLGLAGFGRLAREYYLPALEKLDGARLVAVADPLAESRAAAAGRLPWVAVHSDHRAMLEGAELDAMLVASPPSTHLRAWNDAAARGLPVFVEKPFVLLGQLQEIDGGPAARLLMVDFNRRFWPTYRRAGELLRGGELGNPVEVEFQLHADVISWSTVTRHRFSEEEGGILHDLGGHAIDLAVSLLGKEPGSVAAEMSSERWPNDRLRLALDFSDGSRFQCDLAWRDHNRERLAARGPAGRLRLADPNSVLHVVRSGARGSRAVDRVLDAAMFGYRALRRDRSMSRFSIASALASFVRAVREGGTFSPGFDDAVRNVRWLEAASRSASEGGRAVGMV